MQLLGSPGLRAHSAYSCSIARGILVSWPRIEPTSPALEGRFLIPGPPGKSLESYFTWIEGILSQDEVYYLKENFCGKKNFHFQSILSKVKSKMRKPALLLLFEIVLERLAMEFSKRNRFKGIKIGQVDEKLSQFTNCMTTYPENSSEPMKKLL